MSEDEIWEIVFKMDYDSDEWGGYIFKGEELLKLARAIELICSEKNKT